MTSGPTIADEVFGCKEDAPCDQPQSSEFGCFDENVECLVDQAYGNPHLDCKPEAPGEPLEGSVGPCQEDPLPLSPDWISAAAADSLVSTMGDYDYPFAVHFLYGQFDNGEAPPQGLKYRNALIAAGTETGCESLVDVGHGVPWGIGGDVSGPDGVLNRVETYCVEAPPPVPPLDIDVSCSDDHPNPVP